MKLTTYTLWVALNIPIFLGLNVLLEKSMFMYEEVDGFYQQITTLQRAEGSLSRVHWVRYVAVYPFYWCWDRDLHPVWETVVLLLYMLPVVFARFGRRYVWYQPLLMYLAYLASFRTVLSFCGIAYLFMHLFGRRRRALFVLSGLLANLSSGTVLSWILVNVFFFRRLANKTILLFCGGVLALAVSFAVSMGHKIEFFSFTELPFEMYHGFQRGNYGFLANMLLRGTIVGSIAAGLYGRAILYAGMLLISLYAVVYSLRRYGQYRDFFWFFLAVLPNYLAEGQGPISFLVALFWFYAYFYRKKIVRVTIEEGAVLPWEHRRRTVNTAAQALPAAT